MFVQDCLLLICSLLIACGCFDLKFQLNNVVVNKKLNWSLFKRPFKSPLSMITNENDKISLYVANKNSNHEPLLVHIADVIDFLSSLKTPGKLFT